ncbi:MAG TPA: hypothetical protein VK675_00120 [Candidatus Paceibacterota bacterium]|nr:hypothetical protein [Candidatus Paceibacterota bacterium]
MQSNFPKIPFFGSVIFFIVSCLFLIYFSRLINNNDSVAQLKESQWQIETQRRDEIKALDRSVKIIETERADLETHFAKSSDIVPFLDTIEGLASQVGGKAEVTTVALSVDHSGLLVGMKADGTFGQLYKFLTLLENSPYALQFVSMDLKKGISVPDPNAKLGDWEMIFNIKLLSFIE